VFTAQFVITENCNLNCEYCVPAGTSVINQSFDDIKIEEVQIGDKILGFDEFCNRGKHRKVYPTKVTNISRRKSEVIGITLKNGRYLELTKDHPLLNPRGHSKSCWKKSINYKLSQKVATFSFKYKKCEITKQYKIGYITGMMLGDGSIKHYVYEVSQEKNNKTYTFKNKQYKVRLAVKDVEIIDRIDKYLREFDINLYQKPFLISTHEGDVYKDALFGGTQEIYNNLNILIKNNFKKNQSFEYCCGFLAGIYDAEGSIDKLSNSIRISNYDTEIITEVARCLNKIEIPFKKEFNGIRILSPRNSYNNLKFIKIIMPAIKRKSISNFYSRPLMASSEVVKIEFAGIKEVLNLETESKTFFANGFAVHNCYMKARNKTMNRETFDFHYNRTLPYYMAMFQEEKYRLDLFGGEPTLNWDLIEYIVNKVKSDHRLERIHLMSNGLLIDKYKVNFIKNNNIKFCFSFDGLYSKHAALYLEKAHLYKDLNCTPNVCVTPDYIEMDTNLKFFAKIMNMTPFFKIVRDNIWTDNDVDRFEIYLEKTMKVYKELLAEGIDAFPFNHYIERMVEALFHIPTKQRCYVGISGAAFTADRKVYPCARFMKNENMVLFDGTYNDENLMKIEEAARTFPSECNSCEISHFCDNLCLEQEMKHGLFKNVCRVNKILFNRIIKLNEELKDEHYWIKRIGETRRKCVRQV
jgi:radical SAM protein with 4Fe4S-binding SPASM domain